MILISGCLAGVCCRYDQGYNGDDHIMKMIKEQPSIIVCPEQLGGLATPREPAEIVGGDGFDVLDGNAYVINAAGEDVTQCFIKGAEETLEIAHLYGVTKAILKSRSPSCGSGVIYDGSFSKTKIKGDGVTTALLKRNGIEVTTR